MGGGWPRWVRLSRSSLTPGLRTDMNWPVVPGMCRDGLCGSSRVACAAGGAGHRDLQDRRAAVMLGLDSGRAGV